MSTWHEQIYDETPVDDRRELREEMGDELEDEVREAVRDSDNLDIDDLNFSVDTKVVITKADGVYEYDDAGEVRDELAEYDLGDESITVAVRPDSETSVPEIIGGHQVHIRLQSDLDTIEEAEMEATGTLGGAEEETEDD